MLADVPMVFILLGITAYTVLSGADFGAGVWTLIPGGGQAGAAATRDHTRHAIGPVWEANHVWLIFVLVVLWTSFPRAFAAIASSRISSQGRAVMPRSDVPGRTLLSKPEPTAIIPLALKCQDC